MDVGQRVAEEAKEKVQDLKQREEVLDIYSDTLSHARIREGSDSLSYVTGLSRGDVNADVMLKDFERRLCDITSMSLTCADELGKLKLELKQLMLTCQTFDTGESKSVVYN